MKSNKYKSQEIMMERWNGQTLWV